MRMKSAFILSVAFVMSSVGFSQDGNPYAPTRTSLYMASSPNDDVDVPVNWDFGHNIVGEFFSIAVGGVYDGVSLNEQNELLGFQGEWPTVIGVVSQEAVVGGGELAYPVIMRKITLNDDTRVSFQLDQGGFWVAIFE